MFRVLRNLSAKEKLLKRKARAGGCFDQKLQPEERRHEAGVKLETGLNIDRKSINGGKNGYDETGC